LQEQAVELMLEKPEEVSQPFSETPEYGQPEKYLRLAADPKVPCIAQR